ncbi:hypothetical protein [Chroococcidiopsis sp. SAG 2025]|uniref:hypothetical protein n=1 Tax=Chroococcidiopsis sp. SAG 2025 TaxID=171389 RepID=UPI0029371BB9|nr:hypothetical protein [Chroococcidiopsis sp. SAG 2025]
MRLVAPLEEELRLAEAVAEDLCFVAGWAVGSGSGWGDRSSGMGGGVWSDASGCDFCCVVELEVVLRLVAGFEVFEVALPLGGDLAVVSGSTAGCGVVSGSMVGAEDVSGEATGCECCFVFALLAVLLFLAGWEALAIVLAFELDLGVVSGSTVGCAVASSWVLGWEDTRLGDSSGVWGFGVAACVWLVLSLALCCCLGRIRAFSCCRSGRLTLCFRCVGASASWWDFRLVSLSGEL